MASSARPSRVGLRGWWENKLVDPTPELPDDTPIADVRFPTRIRNVLAGSGLKTVGEVRETADETLLSFQDLGPGSTTCHLAEAGALVAADAVRQDIAVGCDLVLLNKFGKLEAAGGGLRDAFGAAMEAGVPVLTSVSSGFAAAWQSFAAPLFVVVPADADMIDAWWNAVRLRPPAMTDAASLPAAS